MINELQTMVYILSLEKASKQWVIVFFWTSS